MRSHTLRNLPTRHGYSKPYEGKLHDNREPHHTIYEVKMRTSNASKDLEGVYQCGIERQYDKLFVISSVTVKGNISPFPQIPQADLVSCEKLKTMDPLNEHISLSPKRPTCVRCKGFGYPPPSVGIYNHKDQEVSPVQVQQRHCN